MIHDEETTDIKWTVEVDGKPLMTTPKWEDVPEIMKGMVARYPDAEFRILETETVVRDLTGKWKATANQKGE